MILKKLYNTLETKLRALFKDAYITMQGTIEGQKDNRFEIELLPQKSSRDGDLIKLDLQIKLHYTDASKNHLQKMDVFETIVEGFVTGLQLEGVHHLPNQFSLVSKDEETIIEFSLKVCYTRQQEADAPKMANLIIKEE
jgi:hypothetical protein